MSIIMTVSALACAISLVPASFFTSPITPETADSCLSCAVSEVYNEEMDFDGNGILDVMDAVKIYKAYTLTLNNSYEYTFGEKDVIAIIEKSVDSDMYSNYFYYEIDFVDGCPCRKYEVTTTSNIEIHVYCELNDDVYQFTVMVDPTNQLVSVLD